MFCANRNSTAEYGGGGWVANATQNKREPCNESDRRMERQTQHTYTGRTAAQSHSSIPSPQLPPNFYKHLALIITITLSSPLPSLPNNHSTNVNEIAPSTSSPRHPPSAVPQPCAAAAVHSFLYRLMPGWR